VYVCICLAVTDAQVRAAIDAGARDLAAVGRRTGAGTDCGTCRERLVRLIAAVGGDVPDAEGGTDAQKL
jgi:bacterioferritin-associated ferredoxin